MGNERWYKWVFASVIFGMSLLFSAIGWSAVLYHWIQLVPASSDNFRANAWVRVVVDAGDVCPDLHVGQKSMPLLSPEQAAPKGFEQIKLCELHLSSEAPELQAFTAASLATTPPIALTLPNLAQGIPLQQAALYGCTGCRGKDNQADCQDDQSWPFARINQDAAAITSPEGIPPLFVHLGDYRYMGQGEVHDSWSWIEHKKEQYMGWNEEVFQAIQPILNKGYWIFMRGNHEACIVNRTSVWLQVPEKKIDQCDLDAKYKKNDQQSHQNSSKKAIQFDRGEAWLYFFGNDIRSCAGVKEDLLPAYALDATVYSGNVNAAQPTTQKVRLMVMDTVRTGDERDKDPVASKNIYAQQFNRIAQWMPTDVVQHSAWLLSHIPVYSQNDCFADTVMLDAVNDSNMKQHWDQVALSLAAHRHQFELIAPGVHPDTSAPMQYVLGHGGVELSLMKNDALCQNIKAKWLPLGDKAAKKNEMKEDWLLLPRPKNGYLRLAWNDHSSRFVLTPRFISDQGKWSEDTNVSCSTTTSGKVACNGLPTKEGGKLKCQ